MTGRQRKELIAGLSEAGMIETVAGRGGSTLVQITKAGERSLDV